MHDGKPAMAVCLLQKTEVSGAGKGTIPRDCVRASLARGLLFNDLGREARSSRW
jgi:hypothetical protein